LTSKERLNDENELMKVIESLRKEIFSLKKELSRKEDENYDLKGKLAEAPNNNNISNVSLDFIF
jgi:predicted RNase H-like nuclease (RuvC/YqgF family)